MPPERQQRPLPVVEARIDPFLLAVHQFYNILLVEDPSFGAARFALSNVHLVGVQVGKPTTAILDNMFMMARMAKIRFAHVGDVVAARDFEQQELSYQRVLEAETLRAQKAQERPILSPRQQEILVLMAQGLLNKEIAARLVLEVDTVKSHVHVILSALAVNSRHRAVFKAVDLDLVDLDERTKQFDIELLMGVLTRSELRVLEAAVQDGVSDNHPRETPDDTYERSVHTIKTHKGNIYQKLGVNNLIQAGLIYLAAKRRGLV